MALAEYFAEGRFGLQSFLAPAQLGSAVSRSILDSYAKEFAEIRYGSLSGCYQHVLCALSFLERVERPYQTLHSDFGVFRL